MEQFFRKSGLPPDRKSGVRMSPERALAVGFVFLPMVARSRERGRLTERVNGRVNLRCVHRTISLLQCGRRPIIGSQGQRDARCKMSDMWETKDGRRRVRRDPPTIEEAVVAAQGLTDDLKEQMEIVASLMEITPAEARGAVLRMGQRKEVNRVTVTGRIGAPRAVVVERRTPRIIVQRRSIGR